MMAAPFFLNGTHGRLFALYYPPKIGQPEGLIIHIPAFAEEMNKSRRMVALQASALSNNNFAVLVLDLFGTGDSEGLLENASWQIWQNDIDSAIDWLKQQYSEIPLYLWGLRFGCALAVSYVAQSNTEIRGLMLWQPLLSGKMLFNQFLRLRIATALTHQSTTHQSTTHKSPETTKSLLQDLANGTAIEVGGYLLSPEFSASILDIEAGQRSFNLPINIIWLDFMAGDAAKPSPASSKVINHWIQQDNTVNWTAINGDRFWSTQEISVCPELITVTTKLLCTS
ncbi:MAG: hydrolase 2, exosortase A system-associated [Methylococcales bacterium]